MLRLPRSRLVFRFYAIGVVQLLLVVASAIVIGFFAMRRSFEEEVEGLAAALAPLAGHPAELARELERRRAREHVMISIYDDARRLVASNVVPPLPPSDLKSDRLVRPPHPPRHETLIRFPIGARDGLLVVHVGPPKPGLIAPLIALAAGFLVVGVGAFMTAKWIARPLEQLATAAGSLGRGDLQTRVALNRSDELGELGGAFDDMAARIRELLLAEKELLANVSHELRTPLARIRVALEIAAEGDAATARESLAEIALDLSELESLIDDILTATRMEIAVGKAESAGFALHRKLIAPSVVAVRAAQRFRARHPARSLELSAVEELPAIEADAVLLRRVIDNLLENAHKYTPDQAQPIWLRLSSGTGGVRFEVEDRGHGIPDEDLPRLFLAFFRGERSRSRGTGGVGLGLTLAKRIVEAHGGRIEVESSRGGGTLMRVLLPLVTAVLVCATGCADVNVELNLPAPDAAQFETQVYPVLLRDCGFPACHGDYRRFFRVFGPGRTRYRLETAPFDPPTAEEIEASYYRARSMLANEEGVERSALLRKPLHAEHGGIDGWGQNVYLSETDPGYVTLYTWARSADTRSR